MDRKDLIMEKCLELVPFFTRVFIFLVHLFTGKKMRNYFLRWKSYRNNDKHRDNSHHYGDF